MSQERWIVKPGKTITCKMGIVHAGGIVDYSNFDGDQKEKEKLVSELVEKNYLELIKNTKEEKSQDIKPEKSKPDELKTEELKSEKSTEQIEEKKSKKEKIVDDSSKIGAKRKK